MPRKTKLASRREVCLPGRRLWNPRKNCEWHFTPSRPAIQRLVMARRPRNDFRGSISGTAVLRFGFSPGFGFDPRWSGTRSRRPGPIERLNGVINAGLADPSISGRLADLGVAPTSMTPSEFEKFVVEETEKWAKVIKFAGIKSE